MRVIAATLLTLGVELLLGFACVVAGEAMLAALPRPAALAGRRVRACWAAARRALVPAVFGGIVLLGAAAAILLATGGPTPAPVPVRIWPHPAGFALGGGIALAGCLLLRDAGRREARGRRPAARRLGRAGGWVMLLGIGAQLIAIWADLLFVVPFRRAAFQRDAATALVLVLAMLALGLAAFIGPVAGLAGKPRPAVHVATLLYLAGAAGLAAVAQAT